MREYTEETYNVIQGLTIIEESRDTLAEKLFKAETHIKSLQKKLKDQSAMTLEAVERYQNEVVKLQKDKTLESIMINKKIKKRFPNLITQIKNELNRRYR